MQSCNFKELILLDNFDTLANFDNFSLLTMKTIFKMLTILTMPWDLKFLYQNIFASQSGISKTQVLSNMVLISCPNLIIPVLTGQNMAQI